MTQHNFKKVLGVKDITLYTVSAILLVDQIAMAAAVGVSSLFWWVAILLLLFVPMALMTAELGTAYPEQGGIYSWIRTAYGRHWAARITWCYWVNTALWMPAVFIMFAGMYKEMFAPEMGLWSQIALGIGLTWLTTAVNVVSMRFGKWVPNLGAALKVIIILALGIGGVNYGLTHGFANDLSWERIMPDFETGLTYISVITYGVLGSELVCSSCDEMKNPSRDIPRAVLASGLVVGVFYVFGTLGVLAAVPTEDVDMINVIVHTLHNLFGDSGLGGAFALALGVATLFSLFSNMVTWTMGANRSAAEAAEEGELPPLFGKLHPQNRTPLGAAVLCALIGSAALVLYGFMAKNAEELFWTLFAFSAIIFLLPYIGMVRTFLLLRRIDGQRQRPYQVPGGTLGAYLLAIPALLVLSVTIVLFVWVPSQPIDWHYTLQVVIGVIVTLGIGEWLILRGEAANGFRTEAAPANTNDAMTMP